MTTTTMHPGALKLALLCTLVFLSVFTFAGAEAGSEGEFHLKGVLISPSQRSALVNNQVLREGERAGNVKVLAIREGEVDIRMGSSLLTVPVGARADWGQASLAARPLSANTADTANDYGPVKRGETLSQIAESLLGDDVTLNQMMLALYDTNQDAFDGNINVLREGAMLSVPDTSVLHRQAPVMAAAEVVRHTNEWRGSVAPEIQPSVIPEPEAYGPVARGETLSGIAASLSRNGATINQMMVALFEANPLAFDDNINLLKEGAVLQIPDESALHRNSYETATAAVVRHMETHKPAASQPPQPFVVADDLVTMLDRRLHLPGAILF